MLIEGGRILYFSITLNLVLQNQQEMRELVAEEMSLEKELNGILQQQEVLKAEVASLE